MATYILQEKLEPVAVQTISRIKSTDDGERVDIALQSSPRNAPVQVVLDCVCSIAQSNHLNLRSRIHERRDDLFEHVLHMLFDVAVSRYSGCLTIQQQVRVNGALLWGTVDGRHRHGSLHFRVPPELA